MKRILLALCCLAVQAATIAEKTAGAKALPGYFPLYWDDKAGKMWLEIPKLNTDFLYVNSLPAGVGSNDIGLDRGQLGATRIARFERSGPKVLLVVPNLHFRAVSERASERKSVEDSFARSAIWGFEVAAEENGRILVDATNFYLRDAHDVGGTLRRTRQGTYRVDPSRSAFYLERTRNFPKNTEVEVTLTLAGEAAGVWIRQVTPEPDSVTVREHHSFIELPPPGYETRELDPRGGVFGIEYMDFASRVGDPVVKRLIERHRLKKKDPSAAVSDPVKPIVYYLDAGAPEPIRSALLEGARWWNQAFEAAGYRDAFRVELMTPDIDPMDVRYNVIQWVHRATRGWSYGSTVSDPRTGEIIQGHVTLGSLRVRQDYLIAEALLAPYAKGKPDPDPMLEMSLARLRQLAAHEVGHTLGLAHNFAASVKDRASVMDYPHPLVRLTPSGEIDLSGAYATGIGEWDKIAIKYAYQDYSAGTDSARESDAILRDATARGFLFISDSDSRPAGGAHPQSHLWDNGTDAVAELNRMMEIRAKALARFGENNIRPGEPMSHLEDTLVLAYLLHRYQVEAASKVLGGAFYSYALRGDGQKVYDVVAPAQQRAALDALLRTIRASELAIPGRILKLIPPQAFEHRRTQEDFKGHTGLTFDPLGAVEAAANLTVGMILNPERAARLHQQESPNLDEVIEKLLAATWKLPAAPGAVQQTIDGVVLYHLMSLASDSSVPAPVRAVAFGKLKALRSWLQAHPVSGALGDYAVAQIRKFEEDPKEVRIPKPADPPPGQPIGCDWN